MLKFLAKLFAASPAPRPTTRLELSPMEDRMAPALITSSMLLSTQPTSSTSIVRTTTTQVDGQLSSSVEAKLHGYDLMAGFFGR